MPTRNDGRPAPDAADYRLLLALAWIVAPVADVFLTVALVGAHRSPQLRAGYPVSWPLSCLIAAVTTALFYLCLGASQRHGGRAVAIEENWRLRRREAMAEANYDVVRGAYFGRRASLLVGVTPAFLALPTFVCGVQQTVKDPATGEQQFGTGALAFGFLIPFAVLLLRHLTGRVLTLVAVAAWAPMAWLSQDARETAAGWAGFAAFLVIVVALLANLALARRRPARGDGGRAPGEVTPGARPRR